MFPVNTTVAAPVMPTLSSSLTLILSSPPRREHWRARKHTHNKASKLSRCPLRDLNLSVRDNRNLLIHRCGHPTRLGRTSLAQKTYRIVPSCPIHWPSKAQVQCALNLLSTKLRNVVITSLTSQTKRPIPQSCIHSPVTGSSLIPLQGAKYREMKSYCSPYWSTHPFSLEPFRVRITPRNFPDISEATNLSTSG